MGGGWMHLYRDDAPQEHPDYGRMRAVVAKSLMAASPGQFPTLVSTVRVASAVAADVIQAFASGDAEKVRAVRDDGTVVLVRRATVSESGEESGAPDA